MIFFLIFCLNPQKLLPWGGTEEPKINVNISNAICNLHYKSFVVDNKICLVLSPKCGVRVQKFSRADLKKILNFIFFKEGQKVIFTAKLEYVQKEVIAMVFPASKDMHDT